jgi:hypothetical protein
VEDDVRLAIRRLVRNRFAHQLKGGCQSLDVVRRGIGCGIPSDHGLERRTHHAQIVERAEGRVVRDERRQHRLIGHLPCRHRRHLGSSTLSDCHQSLLLHPLHRLTDDRAAHCELLAQNGLRREGRAGRQIAAHDRIHELGDDGHSQTRRLLPRRECRRGQPVGDHGDSLSIGFSFERSKQVIANTSYV